MTRTGDTERPTRGMLAALAVTLGLGTFGLAACGSSTAGDGSTVPAPASTAAPTTAVSNATVPQAADAPVTTASTVPPATSAPAPAPTSAPPATEPESNAVSVTETDVADLERQLDEIDQLLAGVEADLSQD